MTDVVVGRHSPLIPTVIPAGAGQLLGGTSSNGVASAIAIGTNLTLSGGVLSASGGVGGGSAAFTIERVTATGATQSTAASMAQDVTIVAAQSGGNGVILSASLPWQDIRNRSGGNIYIYPPSGEQIESTSGVNMPVTLPNNSNVLICRDGTPATPTWFT